MLTNHYTCNIQGFGGTSFRPSEIRGFSLYAKIHPYSQHRLTRFLHKTDSGTQVSINSKTHFAPKLRYEVLV